MPPENGPGQARADMPQGGTNGLEAAKTPEAGVDQQDRMKFLQADAEKAEIAKLERAKTDIIDMVTTMAQADPEKFAKHGFAKVKEHAIGKITTQMGLNPEQVAAVRTLIDEAVQKAKSGATSPDKNEPITTTIIDKGANGVLTTQESNKEKWAKTLIEGGNLTQQGELMLSTINDLSTPLMRKAAANRRTMLGFSNYGVLSGDPKAKIDKKDFIKHFTDK